MIEEQNSKNENKLSDKVTVTEILIQKQKHKQVL